MVVDLHKKSRRKQTATLSHQLNQLVVLTASSKVAD